MTNRETQRCRIANRKYERVRRNENLNRITKAGHQKFIFDFIPAALSLHMATRNISLHRQQSQKFFGEGLTFDDVLLMPGYSQVLPRDVDIKTRLTKDITLNVPLLSAAMDTVTEATLAIALAREGGLGILHKNMSIEKQAEQVRKVKRSESGLILDPVTLLANATIGDALKLMRENKIGGIPIIDKAGKLVGILTNRDLRFEDDPKEK